MTRLTGTRSFATSRCSSSNPAISIVAAQLRPVGLRTLDAIHVASALALGSELEAFVTYDDRMAEAARAIGLPVVRPA